MINTRFRIILLATGLLLPVGSAVVARAEGIVDDSDAQVDVAQELAAAARELTDGDARPALQRLDRVARIEPGNPWMHYYRGAALLQLRRPYDAMAAFDRALERLAELDDPDVALRERIERHRALARREVFRFDLNIGVAYDTNATFTGSGGQEFGFISGRSDTAFGLGARWAFAPISNDVDVLAFGLQTNQTRYARVEQFDYQQYGAWVRWVHRFAEDWEFFASYAYDLSVLDLESYLSNHTLGMGIDYVWAKRSSEEFIHLKRSGVFARVEFQDFLFPTSKTLDRDGIDYTVGVAQSLTIKPNPENPWSCDVSAGYGFSQVVTEGEEFDRMSHDFFLRAEAPLLDPKNPDAYLFSADKSTRVEFEALWALDRYRADSVFDRRYRRRRDLITTLTLRLSQVLKDDPRYGELTASAVITYSDSDSNIKTPRRGTPFSYDRMWYGIQFAWSW